MEQVFWTVLNRSVTAGWLVLAVLAVRLVLKKAPRGLVCGLWAVVAVRLLWPEDLLPRAAVSLVPSVRPIPESLLPAAPPAAAGGISAAGEAAQGALAPAGPDPAAIAAWVWLAGVCVMALYLAGSYGLLRLRLRTAVRLEGNVWESDRTATPFVLGFVRPRIYLPFGLEPESRDHVLAHERAHIRRRDHWVKPLAFALLAVYWFNPLLWAAYLLLCRDMEYACDEAVLRRLDEAGRRAYSRALLDCAAPRRMVSACPVAFGQGGVRGRIRRAIRYRRPAFWITAAAAAVCVAAAVCLLTDPPAETPAGRVYWTAECVYLSPEAGTGQARELVQAEEDRVTIWDRRQGAESAASFPRQAISGTEPADWAARFPEGAAYPDIGGCRQRQLISLDAGRQLLELDQALYLLDCDPDSGRILRMVRLQEVPLTPERTLELDGLMDDIARDPGAAIVSSPDLVEVWIRELPAYRRLVRAGAETLVYCVTGLELQYDTGYTVQSAMMAACEDILADMGEDTAPYADQRDAQVWYDRLKARVFAAEGDPKGHPGYARLLELGLSRPYDGTFIAAADLTGDGLRELLYAVEGGVEAVSPDGTAVLWSSGPMGQDGDEALYLHRNGGQWELLRCRRGSGGQSYELLRLWGSRTVTAQARQLPENAAPEEARSYAAELTLLLRGRDQAGLSDGCEMLVLSVMDGQARMGPAYDFSGWITEETG